MGLDMEGQICGVTAAEVIGPSAQPSQGSEGKSDPKHNRAIVLSSSSSLKYLLFDFVVVCLFLLRASGGARGSLCGVSDPI